ncbi:MAG: TetR family transcriptional regulator [Maritimibacter sp.]|jgi:AcrR family transcriptional regulator
MAHAPRKQGRQSRAKATEAAIVEAAARILESAGAAGLTTNHIAERAGVSIGSLYQYFPNKQAVIAALLRREWAAMLAALQAVADRAETPQARLLGFVEVAMAHQFARPALAVQLEHIETGLDLVADATALAHEVEAAIAEAVQAYRPEAGPMAARDVVTICRALINEAALREDIGPDALRPRLLRALFGYLDAQAPVV